MNLKRTGSPNLSLNIEIASATILCPAGREHMRVRICKEKLDQLGKKYSPLDQVDKKYFPLHLERKNS